MSDCLARGDGGRLHATEAHSPVPVAVRAPFLPATVALTAPCCMLAGGEPGSIAIQHQQTLAGVVVLYGLTFASINGVDRCTSLLDIALRKAIEGIGDG